MSELSSLKFQRESEALLDRSKYFSRNFASLFGAERFWVSVISATSVLSFFTPWPFFRITCRRHPSSGCCCYCSFCVVAVFPLFYVFQTPGPQKFRLSRIDVENFIFAVFAKNVFCCFPSYFTLGRK